MISYKIKLKKVNATIKKTRSRIGFVRFEKRDGTMRNMWFHSMIPKRMITGVGGPYNPIEKGITFLRDIMLPDEDCIRAVRWCSIERLTVNGIRYKGVENG